MITLQTINRLLMTIAIAQPAPSSLPNSILWGKKNPYVWFGYSPQTIFYHTKVQVSGPMTDYRVNGKYTGQKTTKEVLSNELEGYFISIKAVNIYQWVLPTNYKLFHNLLQTCGSIKYVGKICIWPTENLLSRPREIIRINEWWYDQREQNNSKLTTLRVKLSSKRKCFKEHQRMKIYPKKTLRFPDD